MEIRQTPIPLDLGRSEAGDASRVGSGRTGDPRRVGSRREVSNRSPAAAGTPAGPAASGLSSSNRPISRRRMDLVLIWPLLADSLEPWLDDYAPCMCVA